ncbi:hypothetical protein [Vitiosangium sp. GDMCC 1.1324]|uniref:hypothetical protein n=1 Tax=Vitiosangium sp. (strain GDMCC 1.1324) TaxID=2138576 RepID=UPI000D366BE2|nr:hypothetical protein [Vitiosangium sp. GDMCC 1.1324]PTL79103.1 hypothetical protein DAT35_36455 [Vitiosangium sp. GDMCC 1.1324]
MSRLSLSSLAVLTLLSLSSPALADTSPPASTGAATVTAHLVQQAQATPPAVLKALEPPSMPDTAPPTEVTLGEVVKLIAQAVASRNWGLLACALVLGAVYVVRRFGASRVPWLSSDAAGVALSVVAAAALQLSAALASGTPVTLALVLGILLTAAGASGLFSWGKKLTAAAKTSKVVARPATR